MDVAAGVVVNLKLQLVTAAVAPKPERGGRVDVDPASPVPSLSGPKATPPPHFSDDLQGFLPKRLAYPTAGGGIGVCWTDHFRPISAAATATAADSVSNASNSTSSATNGPVRLFKT